MYNIYS